MISRQRESSRRKLAEAPVECACAGWTTVRRNHASVAAPKSAGTANPFFRTENCLALVTMTCQLLTRIADGSSRLLESDAQHQFRRIEPRYFQAHAAEFPKNVIRKSLNGCFKFPVRAYKFPVPSQKFPVLLSREFCCKPLNLFTCRRSKSHRGRNLTKFPVNFPVSREFCDWRRVRLGLRPPPRSPPNL